MNSTFTVKLNDADVAYAMRALLVLQRNLRFKHLRIGLNAAGGIISTAAKALVRKDSRTLEKSIGVKVTIPDASHNKAHHGKPAYTVIGPKRKSSRFYKANASKWIGHGKAMAKLRTARRVAGALGINPLRRETIAAKIAKRAFPGVILKQPSRYAHLLEKGTKHRRKFPFLEPAVFSTRSAAFNAFGDKIRVGIASEAAGLYSRQRKTGR